MLRRIEVGNPVLPSFLVNGSNIFINRFAQQHATWTRGPSFPSQSPEATARHFDIGISFIILSQRISTCYYQANRFDHQSPGPHETPHDEPTQHCLDFGYAAMPGVDCVPFDKHTGADCEEDLTFRQLSVKTLVTKKDLRTENSTKKRYSMTYFPASACIRSA